MPIHRRRRIGVLREGRRLAVAALVAGLALVGAGTGAEAAVAFVKSVGTAANETSGTSITVATPAAGVAAGNTVIVILAINPAAGAVDVTDAKGNTYAKDADVVNGSGTAGVRTAVFSSTVTTALASGDLITVSFPTVTAKAVTVSEFSGLVANPVADASGTATGSTGTPSATTSGATTQAAELVIGGFGREGKAGEFSAFGGGYAGLTPASSGNAGPWQINKTQCVGHAASIAPGAGRVIQWMMDTDPDVNVWTDARFRVRVNEDPAYYIQHNATALDLVIDSPNECPKQIPQDDPYTMLEMMINKVYHQFDLTAIGTYGYQLPSLAHQVAVAKGPQMLVGMGVSDRPTGASTYPYLKFKATYIKIGDMEFAVISKNSIRNVVEVVEAEKQAIQDALGIPKGHIIINWDHIHYTDNGEDGSVQSVAALTQAKAAAVPVEMAVLHLRTGPGYNYTRYGQSLGTFTDGPVDDNLYCVLFRNKQTGAPVGSWVRFTGHNIVMSNNLLAREMESRWGGVCAIFNGNAGTVNVAIPSEGGLYEPVHMADLLMAQVPAARFKNVTRMGVAWAWTTYYGVNTLIQCTRIGDFLLPVYFAEGPCEQALATAALLGYDQSIVVGYGNGRAGPGGGYYNWNRTDGIPRWQVLRMTQETIRAANIVDISLNWPAGDVNGDDAVDVADLLWFVDSFGLGEGEPGFDDRCDFNSDGIVDVVDLLTFVQEYWPQE